MEATATESMYVGSPILSAFSRHNSWGSDSIETIETYPQRIKEPSHLKKGVNSFNSLPEYNFPPLFEIYVKQKTDLMKSNTNNNTDSNESSSDQQSISCKSSPTEGGDEDGPHLLRWGSTWSADDGEQTASMQMEDDHTSIESVVSSCEKKDIVQQVMRKQIPSKRELFIQTKRLSFKKSTSKPAHSFFDSFWNLLRRRKVTKEKSDFGDLQVPAVVSCSYDLPDDAEKEF